MYEPNVARILSELHPDDVVLDIGGWARPFNRANIVLDAESFATRGYYGGSLPAQGGPREWFSEATWIQRDICDKAPFPFADKSIDFVTCSHVLEDVRDPVWVCAEMIRIGKRGYIEVPSREAESSRGIEPNQVGWSHHRWLVDIRGEHIEFLMKFHKIHSHWRYSLPARYLRTLPEGNRVQWLFWTDRFTFSERTIHGVDSIAAELEGYVRSIQPYSNGLTAADRVGRGVLTTARRAAGKLQRILRFQY